MKIFLAGATGVIGRPLLKCLLDEGHEVTASTRSQESAGQLRARGARPVVVDVFDREKLRQTLVETQPEVVINQLTSIPHDLDPRRVDEDFAQTNRLRTEGAQILRDAAQAAGARQYIAQSYAALYTPDETGPATEDQPLYLDAPSAFAPVVEAIASLEETVLNATGMTGIVLRYGHFYGPGTAYAHDGSVAENVRQHKLPILGGGNAVFSFVHVDDAAQATVRAMHHGEPGIYNIVDDEPAPLHEWLPVYADLLDAPQPMRLPKLVGRVVGGRFAVFFLNEQRGVSNRKAKEELGWQPRYASWRDGFRAELAQTTKPSPA